MISTNMATSMAPNSSPEFHTSTLPSLALDAVHPGDRAFQRAFEQRLRVGLHRMIRPRDGLAFAV